MPPSMTSAEIQLALLQEQFRSHVDESSRTHGELAGDVMALQVRLASLESKTHNEALAAMTAERDRLAETNKHWFRYFIGALVTVIILLSGAGLGMLIRR